MRVKFRETFLVCTVVLSQLALPVAADTTAMVQYRVTATVAPARFILLNDNGDITEILSNTAQNVTPTVYINKIITGQEVNLSDTILTRYQTLLARASKPTGVLYKQSVPPKADTSSSWSLITSLVSIDEKHI